MMHVRQGDSAKVFLAPYGKVTKLSPIGASCLLK